jgi:tetratricopeptide (TPR) repeat protein
MTDQPAPLVEIQRLHSLGYLSAVIDLAQALPSSNLQAQLLLIRCFLDQGRFKQAEAISQPTPHISSLDPATSEIHLRYAFLQIYLAADLRSIFLACRTTLAEPQTSLYTAAIAHDLLGRAIAITVTWNLASPTDLAIAQAHLTQAVQTYTQAGDSDATLAALLKLGQIHLLGTALDRTTAQTLFRQAFDQAQATNNLVRQAEALLRLAELHFDAALAHHAKDPDNPIDPSLYQQSLALYETIGHALGSADVLLSLGSRLIKTGFDGSDAVQQALQIYQQQDNLLGIFNALTDLTSWHLQQGQITESFSLRQEALAIAQEMGFPLAQATAYLGMGDYYFRIADYANALAAYEQVEALTNLPGIRAMHGLALANAYTLMNLADRAEAACRRTIDILDPIGATSSLSLAYFILGNVLSSRGNWAEAITIWQAGLTIDETLQNRVDQAEKFKCIAQATVMQHYRPEGFTIPEADYETAMALYAQAIECLESVGDQQATAAIAGTYQLQGQTAVTSGRSLDALRYLEQARNIYAAIHLDMQTAISDSLLGLLCHDLGSRGYPDLYAEAIQYYEQAMAYFRQTNMQDMTWKVCFYLADIAFLQGFRAPTAEAQRSLWQKAAEWLQSADADIDLVRGSFIEKDAIAQETARLGLVANKEKVYSFAIRLHHHQLHDDCAAFNWLERFKGRVFLDGLAATSLHLPSLIDSALLDREQELFTALAQATTQAEAITLNEQLHTLWSQIATDPAAAEYVTLRQARPLRWELIQSVLQP